VIWVIVAGLDVATIYAFSEGLERDKALKPLAYGIAVPIALYAVLWLWQRFKSGKKESVADPD
jgi:hypothetical protein